MALEAVITLLSAPFVIGKPPLNDVAVNIPVTTAPVFVVSKRCVPE